MLGVKGHLRKDAIWACVSAGHFGCVLLARIKLVAAIGEDNLMMLAEIYYIINIDLGKKKIYLLKGKKKIFF
jgi:hypothetical protein